MKKIKAFLGGVFAFAKWLLVPAAIWVLMNLAVWGITFIGTLFGL